MKKVVIVGGGLAGLISAICIRKAGIDVLLVEKKSYPFHRVCGEYVSNEVRDFLERLEIFPVKLQPPSIDQLLLTSLEGKRCGIPLPLGGFGISRYHFDHFLFEKASALGVEFLLQTQVSNVLVRNEEFTVKIEGGEEILAEVVIGAFGKRSRLDKTLDRNFLKKRSPYLGVKYHIRYNDHPENTIALHNFKNGYCGVNKVEDGIYNLCYLSARSNLAGMKDIREMEEKVLSKNPALKNIFSTAELMFDKPLVINEISFETKGPVENHILMCGDAAGMIAPFSGNGMAMAIHSAYLLSKEVIEYFTDHRSRLILEQNYTTQWNAVFRSRLWTGRMIQRLFGSETVSNLAVDVVRNSKWVASFLEKQTHGKPF